MKMKLENNIVLYFVTRALHLPFVWLPIMYFYLSQVKGFSAFETTFLLGLQELSLIFLELPTGVVADKVSRRFSMILGYAITSLPFVFLPYVDAFAGIVLLFVARAVGKALVSGADSALLYDTLIDLGRTSEYKVIKTKSVISMMAVAGIAMFLGGWLGEEGLFGVAFFLPFPIQLCAAVAAYLMIEPEVSKKAQLIQSSNYMTHTWGAIKIVSKSGWLVVLALLFALLEGTGVNMKWYYPAIFENLGFGLLATGVVMGILYSGKTAIYAIGTKLMFRDAIANSKIWIGVMALSWIGISLFDNVVGMISMLILILMGLELGINSVEELIHNSLSSQVRATAMSFINLLSSMAATVLLWSWGGMIQLGGVKVAMGSQVVLFVCGWIAFAAVTRMRRSYKSGASDASTKEQV